MTADRSGLRVVPVTEALQHRRGRITVAISVGQPVSVLHQVGYDQGAYLLELDADERPVRAYHREAEVDEHPF